MSSFQVCKDKAGYKNDEQKQKSRHMKESQRIARRMLQDSQKNAAGKQHNSHMEGKRRLSERKMYRKAIGML